MTGSDERLTQDVASEIAALHLFFEGWLNGSLPESEKVFAEGLERRLAPGFVNIQPAGLLLSRADLIGQIRRGYGASPDFHIRVGEVAVRQELAEASLIQATYQEYQRGARNSAADNARISSVLLQRQGADFLWLHIHETWLPAEAIPADAFDF